ncbi:MAG TPA: PH domain-containing protein [Anaerolineales bacterium]|nr:PH domain-containing protein [Anaerolineales bacterium]
MSIDKIRAQVISSIWQAIAQSGVDLSAIPQDQQEKLVSKVAESVMITMDSILDENTREKPVEQALDSDDERMLWEGRPFLSLVESYQLTTERIKIITGLVSRHVENFELIRVQDIDFKQGMSERILNIGDITIRGHDPSDPVVILRNVSKPEVVYEIMRKAWLEARKRHGLQFREFM